jgi:polar amino acid transport system substrate-binding protein
VRRVVALLLLVVVSSLAAGCGGGDDEGSQDTTTATGASASECQKSQLDLESPGTLTVATDNPGFQPWFVGKPPAGSEWKGEDPTSGKGYESAVAYAVADELGFTKPEVEWIVVPFAQTYKPGPKNYDFAIEQISYNPARAKAVTFSDSYYDVNQALVTLDDSQFANATSIADLKDAQLGAVIGTTSAAYIDSEIQPSKQVRIYDTLNDNISALKNGQIDGLVTDFPTAYYIGNVQLGNGKLVGRFPSAGGTQEYFGLVLEKDSLLVSCLNRALTTLRQNGTLDQLEQQWITSKANAPLIQ